MQCRDQVSTTSDEINAVIDNILEDDRQEKLKKERKRKLYDRQRCEEPQERDRSPKRNCPKPCNTRYIGVNHSKRSSLRVMEAIRAIERQKESNDNCPTVCEIVNYVKNNFECDGDVDAQVRTALKRTCCQGFVKNEGKDSYSLVGPLACRLTKTQKANANKSMANESRCANKQECSPRRRSTDCRRSPGSRRKNATDTKKSSETELSIPTSVEEDINRQRANRQTKNLQCNDTTVDLNSDQCLRSPGRNQNMSFDRSALGTEEQNFAQSRQSTPRQQSPAREENELVAAARNLEIDFQDDEDDDNESFHAPDDDEQVENDDNNDNAEENDDGASNDSALHQIRRRENVVQLDEDRDRELKRWISNCRKECARRAARGDYQIQD